MVTVVVIVVVSGALILGAAWSIYGSLPERLEDFVVALAGGALIISVVLELVEPATEQAPIWVVGAVVLAGAAVFALLDHCVKKKWDQAVAVGFWRRSPWMASRRIWRWA